LTSETLKNVLKKLSNLLSISIKVFVTEKNPQQKKRKSGRNLLLMKLNTKPLKLKCGLAGGGGGPGRASWLTRARHGYPHLIKHIFEGPNKRKERLKLLSRKLRLSIIFFLLKFISFAKKAHFSDIQTSISCS
jgi:hypothetical protein